MRGQAERKAVNSVIQGSGADLIKAAMCAWAAWAHATWPGANGQAAAGQLAGAGTPMPMRMIAQVNQTCT